MKRGAALQRFAIFFLFTGLCALAIVLLEWSSFSAGVADTDLGAWEAKLVQGARLHPPPAPPGPPGTAIFCRECHPAPPHAGSGIAPAMHNAHAMWMDCLFCHWSDADGPRPTASWQRWPPPDRAGEKRDLLALYPPATPPREELVRLRSAVTARRKCFASGPACVDCHRLGGIAAWVRPGTSPARVRALERLEDYYTLPPGRKWYFPQLTTSQ